MLKKFILITCTLATIFLSGCKNDIVSVPMEEVNIDFNLGFVTNGTLIFNYPSDDWQLEQTENIDWIDSILYYNDSEEPQKVSIKVGQSSVEVTPDEYISLIPEQLEKSSPGTTVTLAEIRSIGSKDISYLEISTKMTEEALDYGLQQGIFTEETVEQAGGREAFINQPEIKQIQMGIYASDVLTNITATYYDDAQKEDVLKAMVTMIQTATLN